LLAFAPLVAGLLLFWPATGEGVVAVCAVDSVEAMLKYIIVDELYC
jgi:hypothetical protein